MTDVGTQAFDPWPIVDVHVESTMVGAQLAAERGDVVVIVDILSFSTTIGIAVDRGAEVLVYSSDEIEAWGGREAIARDLDAEIIAKGRVATHERFSLSPASLGALRPGDRVIFTSWNGAGCVAAATGESSRSPAVFVASLANRAAVARAVASLVRPEPESESNRVRCTIIASAEHWSSTVPGTIGVRPALEDQFGAGAVASALADRGLELSIEAAMAAAVFEAGCSDPALILRQCISGRELIERGFADDVELAAMLDTATRAPCWRRGDPERLFAGHRPTGS